MTLLSAEHLRREFPSPHGKPVVAVDDVSFSIEEGEVLGLIGESGSGKSTTGRLVLRLMEPTTGRVVFDGQDLTAMRRKALRRLRRQFQIVFQEPYESLNPRLTVAQIVEEPLIASRPDLDRTRRRALVMEALEEVGLKASRADQRPAALSGGQQQRVGIARAIVVDPRFIVLDEPTSSLDLTVQASILRTLDRLRDSRGLSYLFISHDIATVRHFCTDVAVMKSGAIVERGPVRQILDDPQHPYTQSLLASTLEVFPAHWELTQ